MSATVLAYAEPKPDDNGEVPSIDPDKTIEVTPVLVSGDSFTGDYYFFDLTTNRALSFIPGNAEQGKPQWLLRWFDPLEPDDGGEHISIEHEGEFLDDYEDADCQAADAVLAKYGFRLGEGMDSIFADKSMCMNGAIYDYWTLEPADAAPTNA
ncbi:hypothetical protein [Bifidobacterium tissieri]|uniref:Uncharacterized protein n=1 Tax=Bifidobacterium tissieri TaxID=1630162 RepID=A0A5M9ZS56_9BIFI|nr:hypothetical protein [Bifidobacterium tissieri]KAA8829874.1 hypothetical protein EM849_10910 [Bifidobacterium tissieri]KAA8830497.1 hypothetical protein EMO89_05830 [Bifidobacterium tissieri]